MSGSVNINITVPSSSIVTMIKLEAVWWCQWSFNKCIIVIAIKAVIAVLFTF